MSRLKKGIYISPAEGFTLPIHTHQQEKQEETLFFRMLYRAESGRIGFDADPDGERLLEWLLSDAWAWDRSTQKMKRFLDEISSLQDPYFFLSKLGIRRTFTQKITYHHPNKKLKKLFDEAETYHSGPEREEKAQCPFISRMPLVDELEVVCQELLAVVDDCDMVAVWLMAQVQAILLLKDCPSFREKLLKKCQELHIPVMFVESEAQLPQWYMVEA